MRWVPDRHRVFVAREAAEKLGKSVRSGHQRTIVTSRLVTRSRLYQPVGLRSRRTRGPGPGHDQQPGVVVDRSTGGLQGGVADPEVVAAQQQVNWVRAAGGRRHHYCDRRPCRTAARPRGNIQRHGPLQVGYELVARGGRPVRPPSLHILTIIPAWMRQQGRCSLAAWPWVLLRARLAAFSGRWPLGGITPGVHGERSSHRKDQERGDRARPGQRVLPRIG